MQIRDYFETLRNLYFQLLHKNNQELLIHCLDIVLGGFKFFLPNFHHKEIVTEGFNSISKVLSFSSGYLECVDKAELSLSCSYLRYSVLILMQFEVFLEKLSGGFCGNRIQSLVVFTIELLKGLSRLQVLFTKKECAAMLIKWGKSYPHCTVTIDDYITWCEVNIQKHITQHLQSFPIHSANSTASSPSNSRLTMSKGSFTLSATAVDDLMDQHNDDNDDNDDDQAFLQIRFISVSSVSSSAFGQSYGEDCQQSGEGALNEMNESKGPQKLRERSNTLERLEEEKRVRWSDEHFGTLVSTVDTTLSLTSETHTYIRYHFPSSLLTKPSPLKVSPSFELIKSGEEKPRSISGSHSSLSGESSPEEFLVGIGSGYDSNEEPTLSAITHPNGVTTVVNVSDETYPGGHHCSEEEDYYGKILLKGKLIPRQRRMRRKSKQLSTSSTQSLKPTFNSDRVTSSAAIPPPSCPCSAPPTFLFNAPPLPASTLRQGTSFDTSDSEKIPIIATIGSVDIDAGQVLQVGEVLYILRPVIYSLLLTQLSHSSASTSSEPLPSLEISLEEILKSQPFPSPKLSSPLSLFLSRQEKQQFLALAISMIVELISMLCTIIAVTAIREEAIQQCKLEMGEYFRDRSSSLDSSSGTTSSGTLSSSGTSSSSSSSNSGSQEGRGRFDDLITAEKCIPRHHPIDEEIKRRKFLYLLNLLKTPLFNRTTLPLLTKIVQVVHHIPLIGSLPQQMLETLCYINRTYFHTSNSSP